MISAFHDKLPEGCWKAIYEAEFYRLKKRKKVLYEENRELKHGLRHLIWSRYARIWYERTIDEHTLDENIYWYHKCGWLCIYPTEENKEDIREDVEKSGMGYWPLMRKRQLEIDHERHLQFGEKGNGFEYKKMWFRKERYNK